MTKCAVKECKNHSSINLKKDGVTYHRFPHNYEMREKWRKIIAMNRNDQFYVPTDSSIICSNHFSEADIYLTKKGYKRLKNTAVPQNNIEIENRTRPNMAPSQNMADPHIPHEGNLQDCEPNPQYSGEQQFSSHSAGFNAVMITCEPQLSSVSTVSSVLDTPKTAHLKNELKKCHMRMADKDRMIRNLKKQNKRLIKINLTLKETVKDLNNKLKNNKSTD